VKWVKHPLTSEQATALYDTGIWLKWTPEQVVRYKLFKNNLFMEHEHYFNAMKKVFGRGGLNEHYVRDQRKELIIAYLRECFKILFGKSSN
jgi:hypothetical protein